MFVVTNFNQNFRTIPCTAFSNELYPIVSGFLLDKDETNITVFTAAERRASGEFRFKTTMTDVKESNFSLLKFSQPDIDYSLDCLAANISTRLNYIIVFPVDCSSQIANSIQCFFVLPDRGIQISVDHSKVS